MSYKFLSNMEGIADIFETAFECNTCFRTAIYSSAYFFHQPDSYFSLQTNKFNLSKLLLNHLFQFCNIVKITHRKMILTMTEMQSTGSIM